MTNAATECGTLPGAKVREVVHDQAVGDVREAFAAGERNERLEQLALAVVAAVGVVARVERVLELVRAHLRTHAAAADVLECVQALSHDDVARRVVERLGPPG